MEALGIEFEENNLMIILIIIAPLAGAYLAYKGQREK